MPDALTEREFSADERKRLAKSGAALPDGSFPIVTREDLANAIQAYGRAGDKAAAKRHIIRRARALGAMSMIPDSWKGGGMSESLIEAAPTFREVAGSGGREWDVLLITAGKSRNGREYPADVLRAAAPLFEGAPCFARHRQAGEGERHPLDKVGRFSGAAWSEADGGVTARLRVLNPQARALLLEMHETGETDFVGFSIDAEGQIDRGVVRAITKANSVDLVAEPAAGGRLQRLVASAEHDSAEENDMTPEEIAALVDRQVGGKLTAIEEAIARLVPAGHSEQERAQALSEAEARALLKGRIVEAFDGVTISDAGRKFVTDGLLALGKKGAVADEDITEAVRRQQDYEAALAPARAESVTESRVQAGQDKKDKLYKALQGWFDGQAHDGIPPLRSLKEGYCAFQGVDYWDLDTEDFAESFQVQYKGRRTHAKLQESLTTASWGQIFADVLYLRLVSEFGRMQEIMDWRLVCSDIVSVGDFRTYHYARVGGYADLTTVAEQATYPTLTTPTDEEQTFSVSKYGGIDDWTMEAALNDVTNKVRQLPTKMADAALRTLYKYVMNMITTDNPTLGYDSTVLYVASHSNTGTTALSVAGLDATQIAMRDQAPYNTSAEVLGSRNKIRYIIVPNELEARALRIVNPSDAYTFALSSSPDADTAMDPARWKGSGITPIVYDYLTDATDWWAVADPRVAPTVVMGFLNGQQTPELFLQDDPTQGSMFTADKTAAKVRFIFGGACLDHRSFYRNVVSG